MFLDIFATEKAVRYVFRRMKELINSRKFSTTEWRNGRRVVESMSVIEGLESCRQCKCGPLYLTNHSVKGEMKLGLGGYLYIQCNFCLALNRIPYGKTHRTKREGDKGMQSFCINTKVGAGMLLYSLIKRIVSFKKK